MISEICVVMHWIFIQIFILLSIVMQIVLHNFLRFTSNRLGLKDYFGYTYIQELTAALGQLHSRKSPGIDGLQPEFYKHFWHCIGQDLCVFFCVYVTKMVCCLCPVNVVFCHCCLKMGICLF